MTEDQLYASEILVLACRARGRLFRRRLKVKPHGKPHECWTNAWTLAASRRDLDYVEGIATFTTGDVHTHAWCVDRKGRVLDVTPGYDESVTYRGFALPKSFVQRTTAGWQGWRSSVLEALAAAGFYDREVLAMAMFTRLTGVDFKPKA